MRPENESLNYFADTARRAPPSDPMNAPQPCPTVPLSSRLLGPALHELPAPWVAAVTTKTAAADEGVPGRG